jgi:hypothetical protein
LIKKIKKLAPAFATPCKIYYLADFVDVAHIRRKELTNIVLHACWQQFEAFMTHILRVDRR